MLTEREATLNEALESIGAALDIPPSKYQQAVERYEAVGRWLEGGDYEGATAEPKITPQGSFRIGTVVRPLKDGEEADYDIDLVCVLQQGKDTTTPRRVKTCIGQRLKEKHDYGRMLDEEGKRCWRLDYAEQDGIGFHMDILPSLPDAGLATQVHSTCGVPWQFAQHAIAITEKDKRSGTYSWKDGGSNPEGYAQWFESVNKRAFDSVADGQRRLLFERHADIYASVDAVPNALMRTPLQRAIQLLKRHRDMRFLGHRWEEEKPISMIITTLAAAAYNNEPDVYSALVAIVDRLGQYALLLNSSSALDEDAGTRLIERSEGEWYIPNRVNPGENFADRWNDPGSHRPEAFFLWIGWVKTDLQRALDARDPGEMRLPLLPALGKRAVEAAIPSTSVVAANSSRPATTRIVSPSKPWGTNVR